MIAPIRLPGTRFERIPAGEAYVVIDGQTGRQMSDLTTYIEAGRFRDKLNTAAYCGRAYLDMALGASADWNSEGAPL